MDHSTAPSVGDHTTDRTAGDTAGDDTPDDPGDDTAGGACSPDPGWTWPPAGPAVVDGARYVTERWAPPSTVRHPLVRLGRWTLLYRRAARRPGPLSARLLLVSLHLPVHLRRRGSGRTPGRR